MALVVTMAVGTSPSHADVAGNIQADLQASGAPVTSVTVDTPAAATTPLDTTNSPSLSLNQFQPYLSPNYSGPLPVAHITYNLPAGHPLSGLIPTPGLAPGVYSDLAPKTILWRLAAIEAVKHAIAAGTSLGGMELDLLSGGLTWSSMQAIPNISVWAPQQPPTGMSDAEVKAAVLAVLPSWVQPIANVSVSDDAAGERVVTTTLALPVAAFESRNVRDIADSLAAAQQNLVAQGAKIGRTVTSITDSSTGDPLYTAADDRLWAYSSEWISPLVVGLPGFLITGAAGSSTETPQAGAVTGALAAPGPWTPPVTGQPPIPR
jgi:hypothetical protein